MKSEPSGRVTRRVSLSEMSSDSFVSKETFRQETLTGP